MTPTKTTEVITVREKNPFKAYRIEVLSSATEVLLSIALFKEADDEEPAQVLDFPLGVKESIEIGIALAKASLRVGRGMGEEPEGVPN